MSDSSYASHDGVSTMDILAAAFFVIAGAWLLVALVYSTLVLIFLRLRARGELGSVYDDEFGRMRLCCGYYIPFGCLFRSYLRSLQSPETEATANVNFMTRSERRAAMKKILIGRNSSNLFKKRTMIAATTSESDKSVSDQDDELSSSQEPLCSICLGHYEEEDIIFQSPSCMHQFHEECILDWLQRQAKTECPCCRDPMVDEDDVWKAVVKIRKQRKRERKKRKATAAAKAAKELNDVSETAREDEIDLEVGIAEASGVIEDNLGVSPSELDTAEN